MAELETAVGQRNQFALYIVRIAVALGIVNGTEPYTGEQIAFLAETAIGAICTANASQNAEAAAERQSFLDAMPPLRAL